MFCIIIFTKDKNNNNHIHTPSAESVLTGLTKRLAMQTFVEEQAPQHFLIDLKLPQETRLRFSGEYEPVAAWRLLSRYISRYPQDLRVHAQRILLATDNTNLGDFLTGALQDLIIALSGKGKPLFKDLLMQARPALSETDFQHLQTTYDAENLHQCWKKGSVLANGVCDAKPLVLFEGIEEEAGFADTLEEARAYIDYGQLEEARLLLENELLEKPDAQDIEEELLFLYQSIRQRHYLDTMTDKLKTSNIELSPAWKQSLEDANSW